MKIKKMYQCGKSFFNNPKSLLLATVLTSSFASTSHAAETPERSDEKLFNTETLVPNDSVNASEDVWDLSTAFSDSIKTDSVANDSVATPSFDAMDKVMSLTDDAVYVIAHFEGVRCRAYKDRAARGLPTIGIGNTVLANGRKVKIGDCLKSEAELIECVKVHIAERIAPVMSRTLDIEHLGDAQIVSLIDLAYNCGAGVFEKGGRATDLSLNINEFAQTGSASAREKIDRYFKTKVYAGGKKLPQLEKRRAAEFRLFSENDNDLLSAYREANLGVLYGMSPNAIRTERDLHSQMREIKVGYNLPDTISRQLNKLPPQHYRKSR